MDNRYKNLATVDLKAIYDFTKEEIQTKSKKSIEAESIASNEQGIQDLIIVNNLIYNELVSRVKSLI